VGIEGVGRGIRHINEELMVVLINAVFEISGANIPESA